MKRMKLLMYLIPLSVELGTSFSFIRYPSPWVPPTSNTLPASATAGTSSQPMFLA
ncbi:Protein of unknown function [Pyronema omphalodes CBS 100304]|uniref:Uncharacterized protein n=1 Tax=Pyronema omphalodes (strain CBS 100304) TaxID=1076935 RepID=U4L2T7_PYROM|nr:Protein of unknown function [Pyronema omphalodes CBS 100304]